MLNGKANENAVLWKKIGGRPSGPAAELVFNLLSVFSIIEGEICMSEIPAEFGGRRDLKTGIVPSSTTNTDSKYEFNKSAFSESVNTSLLSTVLKCTIPDFRDNIGNKFVESA